MKDNKLKVFPILLSGGSGTRLWPVSREHYPKQLVNFIGKDSMLQTTINRLSPPLDQDNIRVVCGKEHLSEIKRQILELHISDENKIICEPCGRNTAPAILLSILEVLSKEEDAILCIFPADHVIRETKSFHEKLISAINLAKKGYIVTFGIEPNYPETGYGYIEGGEKISYDARLIKRFVEKPDKQKAEEYIKTGNFFWNSGMFVFQASVMLQEISIFAPELITKMRAFFKPGEMISLEDYAKLTNTPIDIAVMEKTKKGVVLPSNFGWSDIGTWKSLYNYLEKDENGNVLKGDIIIQNTKNSFILGHERLIAVNGLDNIIVVETKDAVFVSNMDNSADVKNIVNIKSTYHKHHPI
ncbi:MAG: mannose-1-phosphate guanylyltransferase/mannose-6-phosphate isomerase [Desulfobacterales bacterium]|nr:mannose-1-phosphate guanylyltransferase/mannose-6-phosphate isomerase [Desulfobacterales bacterium]